MIELGKFQDLYIVKRKDFGVYVNDKKDADDEASCFLQNRFQKTPASETGSPALSTRIPKTDRSLRFMFQRSPLGQSVLSGSKM